MGGSPFHNSPQTRVNELRVTGYPEFFFLAQGSLGVEFFQRSNLCRRSVYSDHQEVLFSSGSAVDLSRAYFNIEIKYLAHSKKSVSDRECKFAKTPDTGREICISVQRFTKAPDDRARNLRGTEFSVFHTSTTPSPIFSLGLLNSFHRIFRQIQFTIKITD